MPESGLSFNQQCASLLQAAPRDYTYGPAAVLRPAMLIYCSVGLANTQLQSQTGS